MAIGRIELQGQIARAQDFTSIKHNEDNKGLVEQANLSNQFSKQVEAQVKTVKRGDKSEYYNKKFDAKDKGSNEYHGDGGQSGRRGGNKEPDGKVLLKSVGNFDARG